MNPMQSISEQMRAVFNSPSRRQDADYARKIPPKAIRGLFLLLYQLRATMPIDRWLDQVADDFMHLHHDFVTTLAHCRHEGRSSLEAFERYLDPKLVETEEFLDFLECAFKNHSARKDNEVIRAINVVLDAHECPYRLTEFVFRGAPGPHIVVNPEIVSYPKVYLAQQDTVETQAIRPAFSLLADPDFAGPNEDFRRALQRQKDGDFSGCVTLCAATIEGVIKVVAKKRRWKLDTSGVGNLTKAFLRKSKLPDRLHLVARFIAERRSNSGDAHGHEHLTAATAEEARFLVSLAAAFCVWVASELR